MLKFVFRIKNNKLKIIYWKPYAVVKWSKLNRCYWITKDKLADLT